MGHIPAADQWLPGVLAPDPVTGQSFAVTLPDGKFLSLGQKNGELSESDSVGPYEAFSIDTTLNVLRCGYGDLNDGPRFASLLRASVMQTDVFLALSTGGSKPFPPIPTRQQVCGVQLTFQGLTVTTKQYGEQPWFELAYQCCSDPADRASVRQQKRVAGDTHLILEYFTNAGEFIYNEPGQWLEPLQTLVGENTPDAFRSMIEEVIADGLIPIVVFDGDNADNPVDGYPNALRQLPALVALLQQGKDLTPYVLFGRLWDGVFYGSSPDNIRKFGAYFRSSLPNGYLAIEHNPGHIPAGGGPADWLPGGTMDGYDVVMSEYRRLGGTGTGQRHHLAGHRALHQALHTACGSAVVGRSGPAVLPCGLSEGAEVLLRLRVQHAVRRLLVGSSRGHGGCRRAASSVHRDDWRHVSRVGWYICPDADRYSLRRGRSGAVRVQGGADTGIVPRG